MVILLYGSDSYRRLKRLNYFIAAYKEKNPTVSIEKFDFETAVVGNEFFRFKEFVSNRSMFGDKKAAILENIWFEKSGRLKKKSLDAKDPEAGASFKFKDFKKILEPILESKDLTIFINEEKSPPATLSFLAKKPVLSEKFDELKGVELKSFIKKSAAGLGITLAAEALDFLVTEFKSDIWAIMTEVQKLVWSRPDNKNTAIDVSTLKKFGDYQESVNLFSFIELLGYKGGSERKLIGLEKLFLIREEPAKIFNFLASQTYDLNVLEKLADYDVLVKSGKIDYEEILVDLVLS